MKGIRCSINIHEIYVRFLFTYLFIYLFINFAKRPGSPTEQAPLRGPEKKHFNTTNKNDNTLETTKKETEMQKQNWGRHR